MRGKPTKIIAELAGEDSSPQIKVERKEAWLVNSLLRSEVEYGDRRGRWFASFREAKEYAVKRCDEKIARLKEHIGRLEKQRREYEMLKDSRVR